MSAIIHPDYSLKKHNTFDIEAKAKAFVSVNNIAELLEVLKENQSQEKLIIGGGSNMLLTKDVDKLVIHINLKGKKVIKEDDDHVWVEFQGGENWHEVVVWCIENNYGGIENMSLIPGNIGTAPIQNIGAYGVELKDCFDCCQAIHISEFHTRHFTAKDCRFGYRESVFKNELKDQYIITSVTLKLTKHSHMLRTNYGAINEELTKNNITEPTIKDISHAVIAIRQSKLPDPAILGNSGSFFKNPIIPTSQFLEVQKQYPDMPHYTVSETETKVPAGWLIEQAGYKGKRIGDAGVHTKQALVLVNYGQAKGIEILNLAREIQQTVLEKFSIKIETEVNIL